MPMARTPSSVRPQPDTASSRGEPKRGRTPAVLPLAGPDDEATRAFAPPPALLEQARRAQQLRRQSASPVPPPPRRPAPPKPSRPPSLPKSDASGIRVRGNAASAERSEKVEHVGSVLVRNLAPVHDASEDTRWTSKARRTFLSKSRARARAPALAYFLVFLLGAGFVLIVLTWFGFIVPR